MARPELVAGGTVLPPLQIGVDRSAWCARAAGEHWDRRRISGRLHALKRADYRCVYCGFRAGPAEDVVPQMGTEEANERAFGYMQIHPRHGDHANARVDDLDALCPFCHEVLHAGVGQGKSSGFIIQCPWLAQADLCLLLNAMAVASAEADADAMVIHQLLLQLESLQASACAALGVPRLECEFLASALLRLRETAPQLYARRSKVIGSLRYLPDVDFFARAVDYWRGSSWRPVAEWESVYRRWTRR